MGTVAWDKYVDTRSAVEFERLTMLEHSADDFTFGVLDRLGVAPGWRCLDVGAGAGSVARWLAARAGAANTVATDLSVAYLEPVAELGVTVLEQDVTVDEPPGRYDLVHSRFVLDHLPRREEVVTRMASWLKPGGWLVVECGTTVPQAANSIVMRKAVDTVQFLFGQQIGTLTTWARTLPLPLERAGLENTGSEGYVPAMRGGSPTGRLVRGTLELIAEPAVEGGHMTAEEVAQAYELCMDPTYVDYCAFYVAAWGQRGGGSNRPNRT